MQRVRAGTCPTRADTRSGGGGWAVEFYVVAVLAMTLRSLHAFTRNLVGRGRGPAGGARGRWPRPGAREGSPVGDTGPQGRRSHHHPLFRLPSSAEEVRWPAWHWIAPAILAPLTVPVDRRRPRQPAPPHLHSAATERPPTASPNDLRRRWQWWRCLRRPCGGVCRAGGGGGGGARRWPPPSAAPLQTTSTSIATGLYSPLPVFSVVPSILLLSLAPSLVPRYPQPSQDRHATQGQAPTDGAVSIGGVANRRRYCTHVPGFRAFDWVA